MLTVLNSISHFNRYLPHEVSTRFHAVKLYLSGVGIRFVWRRYHISKASLMRWNKRFDGTRESLQDYSHRPHSPHPNSHTEQELKWIHDLHRRNPRISLLEMFGKLKSQKGYSRHPLSLYRVFRQLGYSSKAPSTKKAYVLKPYVYRCPAIAAELIKSPCSRWIGFLQSKNESNWCRLLEFSLGYYRFLGLTSLTNLHLIFMNYVFSINI